jgi:hypothetical protein
MTVGAHKNSAVAIVAGRYNVTLPTFNPAVDDQEVAELPIDIRTRLIVRADEVPGAEGTQWLTNFTTALAAKLIITTTDLSTLRSVSGRIDSTAPTATYYVQLWGLNDVPADATAVTLANGALIAPLKVPHVSGTDDQIVLDFADGGVQGALGLVVGLSTTEFTKTAAGAYLSLTAEYKGPS